MARLIPIHELLVDRNQGWSWQNNLASCGLVVTPIPTDGTVTLESVASVGYPANAEFDRKEAHELLQELGEQMEDEGFTVIPMTDLGHITGLRVSLWRAEDKLTLSWAHRCAMAKAPHLDPNATHNIIMAGPLCRAEGYEPRRIVLVKGWNNDAYVVWTQCIRDGLRDKNKPFMDSGNYFRHASDRPRAMHRFLQRMLDLDIGTHYEEWEANPKTMEWARRTAADLK